MIKHVFQNRNAILTDRDKLIEVKEENLKELAAQCYETMKILLELEKSLNDNDKHWIDIEIRNLIQNDAELKDFMRKG